MNVADDRLALYSFRMRKLVTVAFILQFCSVVASARIVVPWPYDKLFSQADVAVIAEPETTDDTADVFSFAGYEPKDFVGMNTKLKVRCAFKGDITNGELTVLHFRYSDKLLAVVDGAKFVHFRLKTRTLKGEVLHQNDKEGDADESEHVDKLVPPPDYLLFLKKRTDGRYEPVSGQYDSAAACREVSTAETESFSHRYDD
jgi:hypothetical protein